MKRGILLILILLLIPLVPIASYASIRWSISDGTTTKTSASPGTGFAASQPSSAGTNTTLNLLTIPGVSGYCSTRPCTVGFPSGKATPLSTDTFKIQDITSTNLARIEKTDVPAGGTATTGADSVILRGIKVTSLAAGAGKTFTLIYSTDKGDLSTITSSSGNYGGAAKISGQFRNSASQIAETCNNGVSSPCGQLSVKINLLTLDGAGSSTTLTASIPCSTTSSTTSPCGSGGFWNPSALVGSNQFLSTDSGSVGCGTTCSPFWQSTFTAKFSAASQVFTLANSAGSALAPDTPDGLIDIAVALAEPGVDVWVGSCGGVQTSALPYQVTGLPPFGNLGRNQNNSANFPAKLSLAKGQLVPVIDGFPFFESIEDPAEVVLMPADRVRNDACSMSWVPSLSTRPKFSQISQLTLNFTAFVFGDADSGDPRLGTLDFTDCTACFRVEIQLVDSSGVSQGTLIAYLGSNAIDFYRNNYPGSTSPLVLVPDSTYALRVDASGMSDPQPCCISFAEAQKPSDFGKLLVKAITAVIDPGLKVQADGTLLRDPDTGKPVRDTDTGNHLVTNLETVVTRSNVSPPVTSSSNNSLLTVANFQPSCDWPPLDGLNISIYKVLSDGTRTFALNVLNPTIDPTTCYLTASIDVTQLQGSGTYECTVNAFSGAAFNGPTPATTEFIGGIGLPNPAYLILK